MMILFELALILLTMAFSAVFVAYEMALASVSKARLAVLENRHVKGAAEAVFMKNNMEASLAVMQLGITLLGAIAAAIGGLSAADLVSPLLVERFHLPHVAANIISLFLVVVPLSGFTIIFVELVPKMVALNNRERVCLGLAPLMKNLCFIFNPVVRLLEGAVKWIIAVFFKRFAKVGDEPALHELHAAAALARTSRLIGAREEKIVVAAAQLSTRRVKEIIIPVGDICTIPLAATLTDALIRAHMDMHTRFPVCAVEGDRQSIQGYINFKDIVAALKLNPSDPTVKGIVRPIRSVDADTTIAAALEIMIQEALHIMLVISVSRGIIGMMTMEDVMEELVGDIQDEFDHFPVHIHPYAGGWIVGGGITMEALARASGRALPAGIDEKLRFTDWCLRQKDVPFEGGEIITADGFKVTVRKLRRRKVGEASVVLV